MKKLSGFEQIGFTVDSKHDCAYGVVEGYQFVVTFLPQSRQYSIMTTVKSNNEEDIMAQYLNGLDKGEVINWAVYKNDAVVLNIKNQKDLDVWTLQKLMQGVAQIARQNGYIQCCRYCGEEVTIYPSNINGNIDLSCENCLAQLTSQLPPVKEVNLPLGIVGALIGSIIGVAVWVLIYQLGYVAGITGFIMAVCAFKGYELLGGRIDKKGIYVAIVVSVVMLAVAEMICLGMEVHSFYTQYYDVTFFESMSAVPAFLSEPDIIGPVLGDLAFGYVFMAVASFSYIRNIHKSVNNEGVVERLG